MSEQGEVEAVARAICADEGLNPDNIMQAAEVWADFINAARAAIAALDAYRAANRPADAWQPIETAPTDGSLFLVWAPPFFDAGWDDGGLPAMFSLCAWHPDAGFCIDELRAPTHWTPLPAPPPPMRRESRRSRWDGKPGSEKP